MKTLKIMILHIFNELKRIKNKFMNVQLFSSVTKKNALINKTSMMTSRFFVSQFLTSLKLFILKI